MKKVLILCLFFTACNSEVENSKEATERISYFKDPRTGLCFGQITSTTYGAYNVLSIACVPCDSIKNLLIK